MAQILIRRLNSKIDDLRTGEYKKIGDLVVIVCCPLCAERHKISKKIYKISADGAVVPIYNCPTCSFREWLILEAWND